MLNLKLTVNFSLILSIILETYSCERKKDFGKGFIELARSVYFTNDKRSAVKKAINFLTDSGFVEEKSYEDY